MKKFLILLSLLLLPVLFTGCGGGGSGGSASSTSDENLTTGVNQALLGPLSGAEIRAYCLNDLNTPVEGPIVTNESLTDLSAAGTFDLRLDGRPDSEWILVTVTGGLDIDANDDGILDDVPTQNQGTMYGLATAGQWREGCKINVVTDIFATLYFKLGTDDIEQYLEQLSSVFVEDVNDDSTVNYEDVISFLPSSHKSFFLPGSMELTNLSQQILQGMNRQQLLDHYINLYNLALAKTDSEIESMTDQGYEVTAMLTNDDSGKIINLIKVDEQSRVSTSLHENGGSPIGHSELHYKGHVLTIDYSLSDQSLINLTPNDIINNYSLFNIVMSNLDSDRVVVQIPKNLISNISETNPSFCLDSAFIAPEVIQEDPLIAWDQSLTDVDEVLTSLGLVEEELTLELWAIVDGKEIKLEDGVELPDRFILSPRLYSNNTRLTQADVTVPEADVTVPEHKLSVSLTWRTRKSSFFLSSGSLWKADPFLDYPKRGTWDVDQEVEFFYPSGWLDNLMFGTGRTFRATLVASGPETMSHSFLTANYDVDHASLNSLVAYFSFEGDSNDSSGNSNNLQENNVSYSSGATGLAADFNGQNSSLEREPFDGMSLGHTTSFKVYFNDVQSGQMVFQNLVSNVDRTTCSILDGTLRCGFYDGSWSSRSGSIQAGRWYDVAMTWNGSDFELLIDGVVQSGTLDPSANIIYPKFVIGLRNDGLLPFDGSIDEFSISLH